LTKPVPLSRRASQVGAVLALLASCAGGGDVVVSTGTGGAPTGVDAASGGSGGNASGGSSSGGDSAGGNSAGGSAGSSGGTVSITGTSGSSGSGGGGTAGGATGGSATGAGGQSNGGSGAGSGNAGGGGSNASGGRGGSAGRGGAAGGAAGAGGAASSAVCPPAALVCEDFEDGQAQGWSALTTTMTISTQHATSGTSSVLVNVPGGQAGGFISRKGAPLFPLVNKTMWGRVMVWFDVVADGHTDIVRGQSANGGNPSYNLAEQHGAYMLNYYNGSQATDCWARPKAPTPTTLPIGKWSCWEWKFDAGTNNMQFFVDGTLYRAVNMTGDGCLTGNGPWVAPSDFGTVSVGANIAERGEPMKMWFDDIAIGSQERIGCPATTGAH